jgi:crossover junction endodeoxyribonuclease RusA
MSGQASLLEARVVEFTVIGRAAPKGSKVPFIHPGTGRASLKEDSKREAPWAACVGAAAVEAMGGAPMFRDTALALAVTFYFARPSGHFGKRGPNKSHRDNPFPIAHTLGDWDKLGRSLGDALQGIVFDDDSRIVDGRVLKRFTAEGEPPRAVVRVEQAR